MHAVLYDQETRVEWGWVGGKARGKDGRRDEEMGRVKGGATGSAAAAERSPVLRRFWRANPVQTLYFLRV
jgi:hypothetical protein